MEKSYEMYRLLKKTQQIDTVSSSVEEENLNFKKIPKCKQKQNKEGHYHLA